MCISKVDRVAEFSRLHDEGLVRTSLGFLSSSAKPLLNKVVNIVEFPVMEIHTTYLALTAIPYREVQGNTGKTL